MMTTNYLQKVCEEKALAVDTAETLMNKERLAIQEKFVARLKLFVKDDTAVIRCPHFDLGYDNKVEFRCEIGFKLADSDRTDFGSDFYFYFEDGKIKINAGTIGSYGLDSIGQLKRNKAIYELTCVYGYQLEQLMNEISTESFIEANDAYVTASREHSDAKRELRKAQEAEIDANLAFADKFQYTDKANKYYRLSDVPNFYNWKKDVFKVVKVTPKFVEFEIINISIDGSVRTYSDKIRKEKLINEILEGRVEKVVA